MSNLGLYQKVTTVAKKVGGMENFLVIVAMGGVTVYEISRFTVNKFLAGIKNFQLSKAKSCAHEDGCYTATSPGESNEGLAFFIGDKIRILERDGDAVLIEKFGDDNNPYFVSAEFLGTITDYK